MKDYTIFACLIAVCGTALAVVAILRGATPVETIALATPFLGLAGTVMGRDKDDAKSDQNDSANGS